MVGARPVRSREHDHFAGMAQTPIEDAPFRFDLAQAAGPRGWAVEVRLQRPAVADYERPAAGRQRRRRRDGDRIASAWVIGDVKARDSTLLLTSAGQLCSGRTECPNQTTVISLGKYLFDQNDGDVPVSVELEN
jgi:hypothetical protein